MSRAFPSQYEYSKPEEPQKYDTWDEVENDARLGNEFAISLLMKREREQQKSFDNELYNTRHELIQEYPDVWQDAEGWAVYLKELDALKKQNPDMDLSQGLRKATERAFAKVGYAEERGNSEAIQEMRRFRTEGRKDRAPADMGEELEQVRISPEDVDRSLAIAQMAEARKGQVNVFAQREQELRAKERGRFEAAMRARRGYVAEDSEHEHE